MDYSLYDVNGDAYIIKIKKREAILYDQGKFFIFAVDCRYLTYPWSDVCILIDHLMGYRMLNKLKRSGQRPTRPDYGETSTDFAPNHNSTMLQMVEHCPSPQCTDGMVSLFFQSLDIDTTACRHLVLFCSSRLTKPST